MKFMLYFFVVLLSIVSLFTLYVFIKEPVNESLYPKVKRKTSYDEAKNLIESQKTKLSKTGSISQECLPISLLHDEKPDKVIVFYHGYTACPKQFLPLAEMYYEAGYNVFIPLIPEHGYKNRMTNKQSEIKAETLIDFVNDVQNIASNLGKKVEVTGLSGGAVLATWIGQYREDVDVVNIIAPIYSPKFPEWRIRPLVNFFDIYPFDVYQFWDKEGGEKSPRIPITSYPRYSIKAIKEFMKLYLFCEKSISNNSNLTSARINFIINDADDAINNELITDLAKKWDKGSSFVKVYRIPKDRKVPHDMIGIDHPAARTDFIYSYLMNISEISLSTRQ